MVPGHWYLNASSLVQVGRRFCDSQPRMHAIVNEIFAFFIQSNLGNFWQPYNYVHDVSVVEAKGCLLRKWKEQSLLRTNGITRSWQVCWQKIMGERKPPDKLACCKSAVSLVENGVPAVFFSDFSLMIFKIWVESGLETPHSIKHITILWCTHLSSMKVWSEYEKQWLGQNYWYPAWCTCVSGESVTGEGCPFVHYYLLCYRARRKGTVLCVDQSRHVFSALFFVLLFGIRNWGNWQPVVGAWSSYWWLIATRSKGQVLSRL